MARRNVCRSGSLVPTVCSLSRAVAMMSSALVNACSLDRTDALARGDTRWARRQTLSCGLNDRHRWPGPSAGGHVLGPAAEDRRHLVQRQTELGQRTDPVQATHVVLGVPAVPGARPLAGRDQADLVVVVQRADGGPRWSTPAARCSSDPRSQGDPRTSRGGRFKPETGLFRRTRGVRRLPRHDRIGTHRRVRTRNRFDPAMTAANADAAGGGLPGGQPACCRRDQRQEDREGRGLGSCVVNRVDLT
jgi:hypothetical protein